MGKTKEITLITRLQENLRLLEPDDRADLLARLRDDHILEARQVQIIQDWQKVSQAARHYVVQSLNGHA